MLRAAHDLVKPGMRTGDFARDPTLQFHGGDRDRESLGTTMRARTRVRVATERTGGRGLAASRGALGAETSDEYRFGKIHLSIFHWSSQSSRPAKRSRFPLTRRDDAGAVTRDARRNRRLRRLLTARRLLRRHVQVRVGLDTTTVNCSLKSCKPPQALRRRRRGCGHGLCLSRRDVRARRRLKDAAWDRALRRRDAGPACAPAPCGAARTPARGTATRGRRSRAIRRLGADGLRARALPTVLGTRAWTRSTTRTSRCVGGVGRRRCATA